MQPLHLVCLSNIRIKDVRKFVFMYVRHHFKKLTKRNIELAFRRKITIPTAVQTHPQPSILSQQPTQRPMTLFNPSGGQSQVVRTYEPLAND